MTSATADQAKAETTLLSDECHVWVADCSRVSHSSSLWEQLLDSAERGRASKFHYRADRLGYVICHGVLKLLLSHYLNVPVRRLQLSTGAKGKPHLLGELNPRDLRFNLSHSGRWALFAFSLGREVGVDLESMQVIPDWDQVAAMAFTPREREVIHGLPENEQAVSFLKQWTRKEAILKLRGEGVTRGMKHIEVDLSARTHVFWSGDSFQDNIARQCLLCDLSAPSHFAATVAIEGRDGQISCKHFALPSDVGNLRFFWPCHLKQGS